MNQIDLTDALANAKRFIKLAGELMKRDDMHRGDKTGGSYEGCKESSAVRRCSMDLTRSLSKLRKGDRR